MTIYLPMAIIIDDGDWGKSLTAQEVTVPDNAPRPTGIYNVDGVQIFACEPREPLGFDLTPRKP